MDLKSIGFGAIAGFILAILLSGLIYQSCTPHKTGNTSSGNSTDTVTVTVRTVEFDTVPGVVPPPLIIYKTATKIDYRHDTIYQTKAFKAELDSMVAGDTVHMEFSFPKMAFGLYVRKRPCDSILLIKEKEVQGKTITNTIVEKTNPRFSVGLQGGYGTIFDGKFHPYVGIGASLNLFSF